LRLAYGPAGAEFHAVPGSLEHFLCERYCLYSATHQRLYRADIHHLPWTLQQASADLERNTMAQTVGLDLPSVADAVHFSRTLKVLVWAPERLI
jgi:hypothetical protein